MPSPSARSSRHRACLALAVPLLALACQPTADAPRGAESKSLRAHPSAADHPIVAGLLATRLTSLPEGYEARKSELVWLGDEARRLDAVGKVEIDLAGPFGSHKLAYTVYPDRATAGQRFAAIGEPVAGRNVERTEPHTPLGLGTQVWGESSFERYAGQPIVRTSLATAASEVIVLAQVIVEGEAQPPAVADAVELLKAAVAHLEAITAAAADAAPSPQTRPATAPSPAGTL